MEKFFVLDGKREVFQVSREAPCLDFRLHLAERHHVWMVSQLNQRFFQLFRKKNGEVFFESEFRENMEAECVVEMEVTEKKKDWLVFFRVPVESPDAVSRVENDVSFFAFQKGADRVSGLGAVPAVCSKKCQFHKHVSLINTATEEC